MGAVAMSVNVSTSTRNGTDEKALVLLGSGIGPEMVASALGVSVSRISQLLSDSEFASQVTELRYKNLQKHNKRDNLIDDLEDQVLAQIKNTLPMVMRPMELNRIFQTLNAAKRRGQSAPESITN